MALIGTHCSTAGGLPTALGEAEDLGCEAIQVFLKSNRQWRMRALKNGEADAFRDGLEPAGVRRVIAHATYLINLAATDEGVAQRSRETLVAEVRRADEVGVEALVLHPGAHLGEGVEEGIRRVAEALVGVLEETDGCRARILLENAAGQGTTLGVRFADLAAMIEQAGSPDRLGACFDTCHAWAAGYDLGDDAGYDAVLDEIAATVGLDRLHAVHLNDSKLGLDCRRDRHENLGKGTLGDTVFRRLMNDDRLAEVPMILETPGGLEGYREDLRILRSFRA